MRAMLVVDPGFSIPFSFFSAIEFRRSTHSFRIIMRGLERRRSVLIAFSAPRGRR
jgi:hypothetical protein